MPTISKAEAHEELLRGVEAITTSESFKAYLNVVAKFHKYSVNNGLLLMIQGMQREWESLGHIAGFNTWLKLGYAVRKGEKSLKVWAPLSINVDEKDSNGNKTGDKRRITTGFKVVSTFAQPQVDPIPGKAKDLTSGHGMPHKLESAERGDLYALMQRVAVHLGATFAEEGCPRGEGYYVPATKHIGVKADNALDMRCKVTVHELCHHADSELKAGTYADGEAVAEGSAYIICRVLGLDTAQYSFSYISHWGADRERLVALLSRISRVTRAVFGALNILAPESAPAEEEMAAD